MIKMTLVTGALLLSQSCAFAAIRGHGDAAPHKSVVMHVAQPGLHAAKGSVIPQASPAMIRGAPDMSDMWPYYLDLG